MPDHTRVVRARVIMAATAVFVMALAALGGLWWKSEASEYDQHIFKPLDMSATLENGGRLMLHLTDPGWARWRKIDDLVPDHNHLMHLYVISLPDMDQVWHLHPDRVEAGVFTKDLPAMAAGRYALYADIVHADGLPETLVTDVTLPAIAGTPLQGDDAAGSGPPISRPSCNSTADTTGGRLPHGLGARSWTAARAPRHVFPFSSGRRGWQARAGYGTLHGHARPRGVHALGPQRVCAHASFGIGAHGFAEPHANTGDGAAAMAGMPGMAGMDHPMTQALPPKVSFPYGFPKPGEYRIFMQVKRGGHSGNRDLRRARGELTLRPLKDQAVLITGAGRGIGKRLAIGFAAEGARVGLLARSQAELDLAKLEIEHAGGTALRIRCDVRDYEQMSSAVERMRAVFGGVHILIAAAGIQGPIGSLVEIKPRAWAETVETNLMGTMHACRAVLPQMIEHRHGKIVVIGGGGAASPRPRFSAYAASKAAVVRFVETLAEEVRDFNVQVNCLAPGGTYTHMTDEILHSGERAGSQEIEEAEGRPAYRRHASRKTNSPGFVSGLRAFQSHQRQVDPCERRLEAAGAREYESGSLHPAPFLESVGSSEPGFDYNVRRREPRT